MALTSACAQLLPALGLVPPQSLAVPPGLQAEPGLRQELWFQSWGFSSFPMTPVASCWVSAVGSVAALWSLKVEVVPAFP